MEQAKRAAYIAGHLWGRADTPRPKLPPLTEWGYLLRVTFVYQDGHFMNILESTKDSVKPSVVAGERLLARPKNAAAVEQDSYHFCASAKENVQRTTQLLKRTMRMMMNRFILQETENCDKMFNVFYWITCKNLPVCYTDLITRN